MTKYNTLTIEVVKIQVSVIVYVGTIKPNYNLQSTLKINHG